MVIRMAASRRAKAGGAREAAVRAGRGPMASSPAIAKFKALVRQRLERVRASVLRSRGNELATPRQASPDPVIPAALRVNPRRIAATIGSLAVRRRMSRIWG